MLRAGFVLRRKAGPATLGPLRMVKGDKGLRVVSPTSIGSPAYNAGIDLDDEVLSVAGVPMAEPADLGKALSSHKAGDGVEVVFLRRGEQTKAAVTLVEPSTLEAVTAESTGTPLTPEQKQFREAWLGSKVR